MANTTESADISTPETIETPPVPTVPVKRGRQLTWSGNFKYFNRTVRLWPGRGYQKDCAIVHVDDLGFIFRVLKSEDPNDKVGDEIFIGHGNHITFTFLD